MNVVDTQPSRAAVFMRSACRGYFLVFLGLMVFALVFGSNLTTPLHATFSNVLLNKFSEITHLMLVGAILVFLVSALLVYVHRITGEIGVSIAALLLLTGANSFYVRVVIDGLNVHFDSSPVVKVSTSILKVEKSNSVRGGDTFNFAAWEVGSQTKIIKARQDTRIFRTDMDMKQATFYVRTGFFEIPYAIEHK